MPTDLRTGCASVQSKNKPKPTREESDYIAWVKDQPCIVCGQSGPSEAHEINQGQWFTSMPLCPSCHRDGHNGIHGRRHMWLVTRMDELSALNETIRLLFSQRKHG